MLVPVAVVLVVWGGYEGYRYLVERPPIELIKFVIGEPEVPPLPQGELAPFTAPEGFVATIFARDVPGARVLVRDPSGGLLVSLMKSGKVVRVRDTDEDGVSDETRTVLEGLESPHGLVVICADSCTLYVAETDAVKSYSYDARTASATNARTVLELPGRGGHFTRTLHQHPDGERLLVSVGSSCNVCNESDERRAAVIAYNLKTGTSSIYASGLRNTVFMATDPVYGDVWGTDNGRDLIGDDIPPDEVNILREGKSYGWPLCYGQNVHDTDFDRNQYIRDPCSDEVPAYIDLQAHSAALGIAFIPEEGWPDGWGNDILVAYHGSWNRSVPTGYRVVRFDLNDKREVVAGPLDFLTGFLATTNTKDALGRPAGVLAEPGGVVYISDDHAGAIYRVSRLSLD